MDLPVGHCVDNDSEQNIPLAINLTFQFYKIKKKLYCIQIQHEPIKQPSLPNYQYLLHSN